MKRDPKPSAAPRKRCQVNVSLSAKDYAELSALAANEDRTLAYLSRIAIVDFLKQRRAAADVRGRVNKP